MFLIIACVLFVLWLLIVVVFRMAKGVVHLLLLIAVIAVAVHFLRAPR